MTDTVNVTSKFLKRLNLTEDEYQQILSILGRAPTLTELGMFSVMWSEHCSYKSSKIYLRQFPTMGKRVLIPAGKENAGLVDLGKGLAVAFKVESHNHPSAVEPHAGAATGDVVKKQHGHYHCHPAGSTNPADCHSHSHHHSRKHNPNHDQGDDGDDGEDGRHNHDDDIVRPEYGGKSHKELCEAPDNNEDDDDDETDEKCIHDGAWLLD